MVHIVGNRVRSMFFIGAPFKRLSGILGRNAWTFMAVYFNLLPRSLGLGLVFQGEESIDNYFMDQVEKYSPVDPQDAAVSPQYVGLSS